MERTSRAGRKPLLLQIVIKLRFEAWEAWLKKAIDKAIDVIFYSENFEIFMDCLLIFAGIYFLVHIIVALIKGWLLWIY